MFSAEDIGKPALNVGKNQALFEYKFFSQNHFIAASIFFALKKNKNVCYFFIILVLSDIVCPLS